MVKMWGFEQCHLGRENSLGEGKGRLSPSAENTGHWGECLFPSPHVSLPVNSPRLTPSLLPPSTAPKAGAGLAGDMRAHLQPQLLSLLSLETAC